MTRNKKDRRKEQGFTLIEIVAVLVILGILAAVAVPKYFDLQEAAAERAADAAVAEVQARLNQVFAQNLLTPPTGDEYTGSACENAKTAAKAAVASNTAAQGAMGDWTYTLGTENTTTNEIPFSALANTEIGFTATTPANYRVVAPDCD